jgi:hypothetical protein
MRAAASGLMALSAALGCSIPVDDSSAVGPVNTCNASSDCQQSATCAQGKCVATGYDLRDMLLEVRPRGAGTSYVIDPGANGAQLMSQGTAPFLAPVSFRLPQPVSIHGGRVVLDAGAVLACKLSDPSVPAQITFYRKPRYAGLSFQPVQVSTTTKGSQASFDIDLIAAKGDQYDVYIEPQLPSGCTIPPYYLPAHTIDAGSTTFSLPPTGTLQVVLVGLIDTTMWRVELVDPDRGLTISAGTHLSYNVGDAGAVVTAQIHTIDQSRWPILRLTPLDPTQADPKTVDPGRPTVYFSLHGAAIGGTNGNPMVTFTVDLSAKRFEVSGNVFGSSGVNGIAAQLTVQSQSLKGTSVGNNAAYSVSTTSAEMTGTFAVLLPPGDYSVRASPLADNGLSITDNVLTWPLSIDPSNCVCGVPIGLDPKPKLDAGVTTPAGQPLPATGVGVSPSQEIAASYLRQTHTLGPVIARVESTSTKPDGSFSLLVDKATFDLTVQPDPSTNFPWLVLPRRTGPGSGPDQVPPGLVLPSSGFLWGTVADWKGVPVADAEIDAWFPLRAVADPSKPQSPDSTAPLAEIGTVVKIATTSTDAAGGYTLVLPASVMPVPVPPP